MTEALPLPHWRTAPPHAQTRADLSEIDCDRIVRDRRSNGSIWQGSAPPEGSALRDAGFDVLVLCADEHQPYADRFPGVHVIHAPNDDNPRRYPSEEERRRACLVAMEVARRVEEGGQKVLVTCQMGMNRSGFVSALATHILTGFGGKKCVELVQKNRRPRAGFKPLCNPRFVEQLEALGR
jgi:protein-tyrosine phosphatase